MVRAKRAHRVLRAGGEAAGVSASTLSRVENGKPPDMETFLRLCDWLEVPPSTFFHGGEKRETTYIIAEILTDRTIDPTARAILATFVEVAYKKFPAKED